MTGTSQPSPPADEVAQIAEVVALLQRAFSGEMHLLAAAQAKAMALSPVAQMRLQAMVAGAAPGISAPRPPGGGGVVRSGDNLISSHGAMTSRGFVPFG